MKLHFSPGPSQLYPTVPQHLVSAVRSEIGSISHRGEAFHTLFSDTVSHLRQLLSIPTDYQVVFLSSATEAMERIIEGAVEKSSYHLVNGAFSKLFFTVAQDLKKDATAYTFTDSDFDDARIQVPREAELICVTQNETSIGMALSGELFSLLKARYPDKLIAVDIVSSVPYITLDFSYVDFVFFSVQKGFGLPPGLGVLIMSPAAIAKVNQLAEKGKAMGSYHQLTKLLAGAGKFETPTTPNTLGIYLLNNVAQDMLFKGIHHIRNETEGKGKLLYSFFDNKEGFRPFILEKYRSQTVIVVEVKKGSKNVIDRLKKQGIIVGSGYKEHKEHHIRIANFPALSITDVQKLLSFL
ncbi:aminotransferase class V-fold PLP-dependent enzyme [Candidatus Roizmanbacteria bacterium]|nr:aminotransferase class V-fold PLP-dependent enzyme [Candidatus Roizmanbacteria bacterium]